MSMMEIVCPASGIVTPPAVLPVRAHWPVEVTVTRPPLFERINGDTVNPGGWVI